VIDLDVHQGNGTHAIFAGDDSVFTFSMHGGRNFPFHKVAGTLDVELADGTGDDAYLAALAEKLPGVLAASAPDLVIYLAGSDPHEGDRLGRLCLTFDGLARRDAMVLDACREVGIPVAVTIAGGYGRDINDSVRAHVNTVRIARSY
jgi:acetoin utilization deacetylase AcuC-like enzyme